MANPVLAHNSAGPVLFLFSAIRLGSFLFGELRVKDVTSAQVLGHSYVIPTVDGRNRAPVDR